MQILGLHTIKPIPICRSTLLGHYTDAPSQTHLGDAHHCHMKYLRQKLPQYLQQKLAKRASQKQFLRQWKINSIHNDPYPSALCKNNSWPWWSKELPSYHHHQTPQGPQDKNSTLDPPQSSDEATQHSSSPNLIRNVLDWRDWTYTDGILTKHEDGQDTESGVYHPCLNISHYVNPRGVGITKTISRAELPTIAAAIIHGYSHIATDSLTSMHHIKEKALTPKPPPPPHPGRCPPIHCQSNPPVTISRSFPHSQIPRRYCRQWICWRFC